jgi:hypothetical protein
LWFSGKRCVLQNCPPQKGQRNGIIVSVAHTWHFMIVWRLFTVNLYMMVYTFSFKSQEKAFLHKRFKIGNPPITTQAEK